MGCAATRVLCGAWCTMAAFNRLNDENSVGNELFKAGLFTEGYHHVCLPNAEANKRKYGEKEFEI